MMHKLSKLLARYSIVPKTSVVPKPAHGAAALSRRICYTGDSLQAARAPHNHEPDGRVDADESC